MALWYAPRPDGFAGMPPAWRQARCWLSRCCLYERATMTLLCLLIVPFIGGSLCCWLQRFGAAYARRVALGTMALTLALAAGLWLSGDYSQTLLPAGALQPGHWAQHFSVPWIPRLGIRFSLGLDGLSLLL